MPLHCIKVPDIKGNTRTNAEMITAVRFSEQPIPLSQSVTHTASITILPDTTGSKKTGEVGKRDEV